MFFMTPAIVSLVWPIRMLFTSKPVMGSQWLLCIMQVLTSVAIVLFAAYHYHLITLSYLGNIMYTIVSMFIFPVFYIFICELTGEEGATLSMRRWGFLPALLYCLVFVALVIYLGTSSYELYVTRVLDNHDYSMMPSVAYNLMIIVGYFGFRVIVLLQVVASLTIAFLRLRRFRDQLIAFNPAFVSKARGTFMIAGLTFLSTVIIYAIVLNPYPKNTAYMGLIYVLLMAFSFIQYFIGYLCYNIDMDARQMAMLRQRADQIRNNNHLEQ